MSSPSRSSPSRERSPLSRTSSSQSSSETSSTSSKHPRRHRRRHHHRSRRSRSSSRSSRSESSGSRSKTRSRTRSRSRPRKNHRLNRDDVMDSGSSHKLDDRHRRHCEDDNRRSSSVASSSSENIVSKKSIRNTVGDKSSKSSSVSPSASKYHQQDVLQQEKQYGKVVSSLEGSNLDTPKPPSPSKILKNTIQFGKPGTVAKPGIQMKLAPVKTKPEQTKKISVASAFNNESDDEVEEMPPECKMRMRNIGRDTPTSSGPNSFGKTKQGFIDSKKIFERSLREAAME